MPGLLDEGLEDEFGATPRPAPKLVRARPKPTANAKSDSASSRSRAGCQKNKENNDFRYRLKHAPEEVQSAWAELKDELASHSMRADLYNQILNVKKGDYSGAKLVITGQLTNTSGTPATPPVLEHFVFVLFRPFDFR